MLELLHELRSVPIPNPVLNSEDTSTGTGQAEGKEGARHKQELGRETGRQINASVAAKRKTGSQRSKNFRKTEENSTMKSQSTSSLAQHLRIRHRVRREK